MRKYIAFLLLLILSMGAVSAFSGMDDIIGDSESLDMAVEYFDKDTNVTVGNNNFTIPEGFGQIDLLSVNLTGDDGSEEVKFFRNAENKIILISLTSIEQNFSSSIDNYISKGVPYENKTIKGHDGAKWVEQSYSFFAYAQDNNIIVLQAPDDSYFEKMIV